jgi:carbohydrate kinase (thermoresistant glucokinase family)
MSLGSRRKITAIPADLSDSKLGLSEESYTLISRNLNAVIHCAWSVNFNMQLTSFEKDNIAGVRNLLLLCRNSHASMNFCSSVSTCSNATRIPVPEALPDLDWAQGMGYAQSKSVAEHLCANAASQGVTSRVLRVGQIVGDTKNGVWNAQEAVPMLMQTAVTVGVLPKLKETPSWLPVDTVAEAIVDISLSKAGSIFTNVLHPKTFSFEQDLLPKLRDAGLTFETVEPKEWIRRLRSSNSDPKINPPIKLVDFFASKYDKDDFAPSKDFATDVACSFSPALAQAPVLDEAFVKKFVDYFMQNYWSPPRSKSNRKVFILTGSREIGKAAIGASIAGSLRVPFVEGDSLYSSSAMEKLRSGTQLADSDSSEWLTRLLARTKESTYDLGFSKVVVSCSALRRSSRYQLREALGKFGIRTMFVDMQVSADTLFNQLTAQSSDEMDRKLLDDELEAYESPAWDEFDVLPVDAEESQNDIIENMKWLVQNIDLLD